MMLTMYSSSHSPPHDNTSDSKHNNNPNPHPHPNDEAGRSIASLAAQNARSIQASGMRRLPSTFEGPGPNDVICARGKKALQHHGNRVFRALIQANLKQYSEAATKLAKSLIVSAIVDTVRQSSPDGGFVKQEGGVWYEVGDHIAREKCGQRYVLTALIAGNLCLLMAAYRKNWLMAGCLHQLLFIRPAFLKNKKPLSHTLFLLVIVPCASVFVICCTHSTDPAPRPR